ncbi:MAG: hypothetical protein Kow00109_05690 [Acidobacteriota bacterium]
MRPVVGIARWSILLLLGASALQGDSLAERVRKAAVAGSFYPGDREKLEAAVRAFLASARHVTGARPAALVAPHAGYVYSGQIAADAYRHVQDHTYDLVVVLGTNHTRAEFRGVSFYRGDAYETPLGRVPLDRELTDRLIAADSAFSFHPAVHEREHSVEVQLPFLQVVLPDVPIVAGVVGAPDLTLARRLAERLAELGRERRILVVASSDLSHYPPYRTAREVDLHTLRLVSRGDALGLAAFFQGPAVRVNGLATAACGAGPILTVLEYARLLGTVKGALVSYANSGDTILGDDRQVVGYGAVLFVPRAAEVAEPEEIPAERGRELEDPEKLERADLSRLVAFARRTLQQFLDSETLPLPRGGSARVHQAAGVFVTLRKAGQLRGCVGRMRGDRPLLAAVGRAALAAATEDPRFPPVRRDELADIRIEVSVLTPLRRVAGAEEIVSGRDGVYLVKGDRSATLLPEVWEEFHLDKETFLDLLCRKAGLGGDCWRSGAELFTYQAVVADEGALAAEEAENRP